MAQKEGRTMPRTNILVYTVLACLAAWPMPGGAREPDRIKVLYQFGADGNMPYAGIVFQNNAIYGTTAYGGSPNCGQSGCGSIFRLTPSGGSWQHETLYTFQGGADGGYPAAPVTVGDDAVVYGYTGTTTAGSVFKLTPVNHGTYWNYQLIYSFPGGGKGNLTYVAAPLLLRNGTLFGVASGGAKRCRPAGCGILFRLEHPFTDKPVWTEHVLYRFTGQDHDGEPTGISGFDSAGGLYVSLAYHGGSIVRLAPRPEHTHGWTEQLLATFHGKPGTYTVGNLVLSPSGTLYGTFGHDVFSLTQVQSAGPWTKTKLATVGVQGYPPTSLAPGPDGSLIGTIYGDQDLYFGNAFQLTPPSSGTGDWDVTQLWNFNRGPDQNPNNIVQGRNGTLVGVLSGGGYTNGTVFALKPRG
jgi:hypothetical protein